MDFGAMCWQFTSDEAISFKTWECVKKENGFSPNPFAIPTFLVGELNA